MKLSRIYPDFLRTGWFTVTYKAFREGERPIIALPCLLLKSLPSITEGEQSKHHTKFRAVTVN